MFRSRVRWDDLSAEGKREKATILADAGNHISVPAHLPYTPRAVYRHLQGTEALPEIEAYVIARIAKSSGMKLPKGVPGPGLTGGQIAALCVIGVCAITVLFVVLLGW